MPLPSSGTPGRGHPLLLLLALTALACGKPLGPELIPPEQRLFEADAIVVLGNRPPLDANGEVAPETARRVRRGVELFEQGLAPILVVTGGPAPHGGTEAEVMARYAEQLGVPADAIRREERARGTAGNAGYSVALLCEGRSECAPSVIVVSTPYHLRRATELFECAGARVQASGTPIPDEIGYQVGLTAYEYGVRMAYLFMDPCERARTLATERAGR